MMNPTQVRNLAPGQQYVGRGSWWLTVESVKTTPSQVQLTCVNAFGETVVERYAPRQHVDVIQERKPF